MVNQQRASKYWRNLLDAMRQEGVLDTPGVEAAFAAVPRHLFLPGIALEDVYANRPVGLKQNSSGLLVSSSSQPTMMAIMLDQAQLQAGDNVLEIGTASGYNAAIMKHIVGEDGYITSIEIDKDLAQQASENLLLAGISDVHVVHGDGAQGYAPRASYDAIIVTAGIWDVPQIWMQQLKPDGVLVAPIVLDGIQVSARFEMQADGTLLSYDNRPCAFVALRGQYAGPDIRRQIGSTSLYILADEAHKIDTAALHLLLSDDHSINHLTQNLSTYNFWYGFQLYLMLNEPQNCIFMVYAVLDGQQAYGLESRGIALYMPGSAAFANYGEQGAVHSYAGADAFLEMQRVLKSWLAVDQPGAADMRLRIIPKKYGMPQISQGKLYHRRDNYVHVWQEI